MGSPCPPAGAVVCTAAGGGGGLGGGGGGGLGATLDPNTAVLATIAWLAASVLVASLWTERAEIGG